MPKRITVTATGDALITRRMPPYEDAAFLEMVRLIQSADVKFTNVEIVLSDYRGTPVVESSGMNLSAEPAVAADLMRLGLATVNDSGNIRESSATIAAGVTGPRRAGGAGWMAEFEP